jgi:hypothetical protein
VTVDPTFLNALFGQEEGYVHLAVGRDAMLDQAGKYRHRRWHQSSFQWPQNADGAVDFMDGVLAEPGYNDLYVCPNLLTTKKRLKGTAASRRLLHADADDGADLSKVGALGGFAVASGSEGHTQVYVPVARDTTNLEYDALQHGMRAYFNGDNKVSDNDLLRPVGSFNHKAVVLHGLSEPYSAEWMAKPTAVPMEPDVVAGVLGIELPPFEGAAAQANPAKSSGSSGPRALQPDEEAFDLNLYPEVQKAIEKVSNDRRVDTHRVVNASFQAGLQLRQIRWAVNRRADLRDRLDERCDDDVARIFCALADAEQQTKSGQSDFFDRVDEEVQKLRVREAARKQLESERQDGVDTYDAGLLQDILDRPAEEPYRIAGLIPSNGATLVVAQRKTGKTTLMLNLARTLVTGELFLAKFPVLPVAGRIALLNFEVSGAQLASWAQQVGVPVDKLFIVNLRGRRNPLTHYEDRLRLAALLQDQAVEALIIDPFGRACGSTNQNDSGEVSQWLVDVDRFARAEVGATDLILTTHAGWNAQRTRGSSVLEDWADSVITMTRDEKDEDARYFRAIGRDVQVDEDRLRYDPQTRLLSLTGSGSRKQNHQDSKVELLIPFALDHVRVHPGASVADIIRGLREQRGAAGVAFQDNDVRQACRLAEKTGRLRRVSGGSGKATRHFVIDDESTGVGPGPTVHPHESRAS